MCGLSTDTDSLSESAATSCMSLTVCAFVSGPSSEANTVSLTGPPILANSCLTASSSCVDRNPIPELSRAPDDLERPAITGGVDARGDQRRPRCREGSEERPPESGLVLGVERLDAERTREGSQIHPA